MWNELEIHQESLRACQKCPNMTGPPVVCGPVKTKVLLIGQAPGVKEPELQRPFAWTAGKTLFKWFERSVGVDEARFRERIYMSATCRCFPGKDPKGSGDRVPNAIELEACSGWLEAEFRILQPELVLPIGKLAISRFLTFKKLIEVIGTTHRLTRYGCDFDLIPLPHPSGASTWHNMEPGKSLTKEALGLIADHPIFQREIGERI